MDLSGIQRQIKAADLPLEKLAASEKVSEPEKMGELCRQFESVLLRQILASAQKPLHASAGGENSTSSSIYRDMVTSRLAESISHSGALRLAETLSSQFRFEQPTEPQTGSSSQKS